MSKITIHAGDFDSGSASLSGSEIRLPRKSGQPLLVRDTLSLNELVEVDIATEESVKRIGGTVGWGAAGAFLLGPVGLLAGLLLGGKKKQVTFVAKFNEGKKMLASTDGKTYTKLQATVFK